MSVNRQSVTKLWLFTQSAEGTLHKSCRIFAAKPAGLRGMICYLA